jgi:hypothetical protein
MNYIVFSEDWSRPVYFCPHMGNGFTVSTDHQKAQTFPSKKEALAAMGHFSRQSNMTCEVKKT